MSRVMTLANLLFNTTWFVLGSVTFAPGAPRYAAFRQTLGLGFQDSSSGSNKPTALPRRPTMRLGRDASDELRSRQEAIANAEQRVAELELQPTLHAAELQGMSGDG